jgi:hypothetical protein
MQYLLDQAATGGATTATFDLTSPYTQVGKWEYYKELVFTLETASEEIFQQTKRGRGNFLVCGSKLYSLLAGLDDFEPALKPGSQLPAGPYKAGVFRGRWTVYNNPFYASNKALLGFSGGDWLNAGAVYAPYLPAFTTPVTILDDMRYRAGTMTVYGKAIINPKFYCELTITES